VFNNSSGYEGWHASFPAAAERVSIVGKGGGELAIFRQVMSFNRFERPRERASR
jgi:hypothetical protein